MCSELQRQQIRCIIHIFVRELISLFFVGNERAYAIDTAKPSQTAFRLLGNKTDENGGRKMEEKLG